MYVFSRNKALKLEIILFTFWQLKAGGTQAILRSVLMASVGTLLRAFRIQIQGHLPVVDLHLNFFKLVLHSQKLVM